MERDEKPRPALTPNPYEPKRPTLAYLIAALGVILACVAVGLQENHHEEEAPFVAVIGLMLIAAGVFTIWKARDE